MVNVYLFINPVRSYDEWQVGCIFPEKVCGFSEIISFFRIILGEEMDVFVVFLKTT
jgi:hypothetical protein